MNEQCNVLIMFFIELAEDIQYTGWRYLEERHLLPFVLQTNLSQGSGLVILCYYVFTGTQAQMCDFSILHLAPIVKFSQLLWVKRFLQFVLL